jgi:methyl acetate hydrolase
MKKLSLVVLAVAASSASPASTQNSTRLDALLRTAVEQKRVPMAVAIVADSTGVIHQHAQGAKLDAIFAIASMTKPITSVAVMQLVEAGKVKLDEPAKTYVTELGNIQVLEGGTLRPPKTPVTVRHLLTHTSGFGYEFSNRTLFDLVAKKELASLMAGGDAFLKAPLLFDPGSRWEYGTSTDWLGRLVERVSGRSLEVYFREKLFDPLGMRDSFFNVPAEKQPRVVPTFARNESGALASQPRPPARPAEFFSGGGGLFSTAPDYMRFVRALMADGALDGRRILSAQSLAMMGKNQIGELAVRPMPSLMPQLAVDRAELPGAPDKFGLGFALNTKSMDTPRGVNTLSWAGIFNTFFWIDREKQIGAVLMTQMVPFMEPGVERLLTDFERTVYERTRQRTAGVR